MIPPTTPRESAEALARAVEAGADEAETVRAWRIGRAADVPIGPRLGVLRLTRSLGAAVLALLRTTGTPLGPVLENRARGTYEFVVAPDAEHHWPRHWEVKGVDRGNMQWPAPAGRAPGRYWLVPPTTAPAVTDRDRLHEAITAALAARRRDSPQAAAVMLEAC